MTRTVMTLGCKRAALLGAMLMMATGTPLRAAALPGAWSVRAPLPMGVAEVGVAAAGGKIFVIGGAAQQPGEAMPSEASVHSLVYDPLTDRWSEVAPLPRALSHPGVAVLRGKIYVLGGFTANVHMNPVDSVFVYDPKVDRWKALPHMSSARGSVAVAALGGKLHVFGGRLSNKVVKAAIPGGPELSLGIGTINTHEVFDPATGHWSAAAPLPGPGRDHMGVAVLDGKVHVFGGRINDFSDLLDRHDVYDPATNAWSSAAPLPQPRSAGAYTVLDGRILYAGGECKPGGQPMSANVFEQVSAYDSHADRWDEWTPLPKARQAFGAAVIGHIAYFAGGAPVCGGGATTDFQALARE